MKKHQLINAMAVLVMAVLFSVTTSCNSNDEDDSRQYCLDFVTYEGESGSGATFSFRVQNDSPVIKLTSPATSLAGQDVKVGDRLVIYYTNDGHEPYTSGNITLYSVSKALIMPVEEGSITDNPSWNEFPITLEAAWRSGKYINFSINHYFIKVPKVLKIVYSMPDAEGMCDAWLIYIPEETSTVAGYVLYSCADISPMWDNGECRGIRLHICDSNAFSGDKTIIFMKE